VYRLKRRRKTTYTKMTKTTTPTQKSNENNQFRNNTVVFFCLPSNAMQISFRIFWEIKVDDDVDRLNVNAAREKIRRHQITRRAFTKILHKHEYYDLLSIIKRGNDVLLREIHGCDVVDAF
jgi:hypothetical protein